ncbi:hypothetical protein B7494_g7983 [Chlorociboria aeruginascens]|nr:hypothetical protein B7494_g7983 [Chlorociboria aeruginascens]
MDSVVFYNDDDVVESHLSKSQSLERAYEETLREADVIVKDESARRLRLRIMVLENENDDLHEQLALEDDRIDGLEQEREDLRSQLESSQEDTRRYETELRLQSRELSNLKAQLTSMNGVTMDTTKLLTEKLALTRELATLKPELEHLRSQGLYQQTVLSEKLALQRQVSTLEVELEAEKRASNRAAEKNNNHEKEVELQQQLDDLRKDLAHEKREKEKMYREAEKESSVSGARIDLLQSKLEQMRTKLRSTKEQLKECQTELGQARATSTKIGSISSTLETQPKNPRKRRAMEISADVEIGTPDGVAVRGKRPGAKRGRLSQTMLGEKSMFSITPYLNRTVNMAPDPPGGDMGAEIGEDQNKEVESDVEEQRDLIERPISNTVQPSPSAAPKDMSKKKLAGKASTLFSEERALSEAKTGTNNKKPAPKKSRKLSSLEKVTEEDDENEQPKPTFLPARDGIGNLEHPKSSKLQAKSSEETDLKRKKRKVLGGGKTIFDEDGEATKRPSKITLGPPKSLDNHTKSSLKAGKHPVILQFSIVRFSSSSTRWTQRQGRDSFAREAKVQGLKSRAAFKLLEIDSKYRLFKKGQTVVDLVAVERTKPNGRILGIDIIPAQPPKGVSTIQGNFLSVEVQAEVKRFLRDPDRGRPRSQPFAEDALLADRGNSIIDGSQSYIDLERQVEADETQGSSEKMVDVVLSDMSAPWHQTTGFWKRSLSDPYIRMMNTSGINFKDHAGSMDLCAAALQFCYDTLRVGGHFVCKFYQGAEDKEFEGRLRRMFGAIHREKPESSRSESKEAYFVALRRKKEIKN